MKVLVKRQQLGLTYLFLLLFIVPCTFCSCNKDNSPESSLVNSKTEITFPSAGGTESIVLNTFECDVAKIIDLDSQSALKGEIILGFDKDHPQTIYNDTILCLKFQDSGTLKADLGKCGFTIDRYTSKTLHLTVQENKRRHPFHFAIVLQSGNETQQISVTQEASHTYHFKSIAYSLEVGDGTSAPYWYDDTTHIYRASRSLGNFSSVVVLSSIEMPKLFIATFKSDDSGAFGWLSDEDSNPDVNVPIGIVNGVINYYKTTREYNDENKGLLVDYSLPAVINIGLNKGDQVHFKHEVQKTIVTYTLILTDLQTNKDRTIKGKWLLIQPTGKYEVVIRK